MASEAWLTEHGSIARRGVVLAFPLGFALALLTTLYPLPGMALGLGLGGALLLSRHPGLVLVPFVISLAIPIQKALGGIPVNAADGLLVIWCLLWPFMLMREEGPRLERWRAPILVRAITPFLIAICLAQVGSIAQGNSLKQLLRIVEWFMVLPLLMLVFRPDPRFWLFVALTLLLVPCLFAVDGLYELASNGTRITGMLGIPVPIPEGDLAQIRHTFDISGRAGSAFGGAQGLAMYLVMCMSVAIAHLFLSPRPWLRLLAGLCLLVCLAGLAATKSRGGLLGALTLVLVMQLVLRPGLLRWLVLAGLFGALGLLAVLALSPTWDGTLAGLVPGRPEAVLDRLIIWGVVFDVFKDNPLLGVGLGNFRDEFFARSVTLNVELGYASLHAHNTYLEILAGTGLLGLLGYVAFLVIVARALARRWRERLKDDAAPFTLAAIGTLAAYMVFASVDMLLLQNMHFLLVVLLGLGLSDSRAEAVGLARLEEAR
ncbi:O-antigen ligase family protein [Pseudomonas sp. Gutcm_11s]|uniref:O-antigen ligase family protein n=1 Tax=Pseudomonas sp. Gutcm_11s TaxID=3026088 RepID=UPI002360F537|nr:O-antigen ligase family protein [Pseudomonas sp. Gutcm_11s]MDD0841200.1 O-antigen ligase family protein [Pseudomonas sp. Gutcm_11s]